MRVVTIAQLWGHSIGPCVLLTSLHQSTNRNEVRSLYLLSSSFFCCNSPPSNRQRFSVFHSFTSLSSFIFPFLPIHVAFIFYFTHFFFPLLSDVAVSKNFNVNTFLHFFFCITFSSIINHVRWFYAKSDTMPVTMAKRESYIADLNIFLLLFIYLQSFYRF